MSVALQCETCRSRKRKCIPTSGIKCERCTEHGLVCVISPPTGEQREARRTSGGRQSDTLKMQMNSDSEASFNSLFDEPVRKRPIKRTASTFVAQSGYKYDDSIDIPVRKKQRATPPSQITTPPRIPVSPAPLAKMVSARKDLPKLSIPQPVKVPITTITASPFKAKSGTDGKTHKRSPSSSAPLTATPTQTPQYYLENTSLKVHLQGSEGYKPLLLKDCMNPSKLFTRVIETWSLSDDTVNCLHITFPWLRNDDTGRLILLERQNVKAGLVCICDEVQSAPCWAGERGRCSIDVLVVLNARMPKEDRFDGPRTRDGRAIPSMSVNANRIYWAMRASRQAGSGLHSSQIAAMVGMELAEAVVAGDELLEHCLICTGEEDYDIWRLVEV